MQGSPHGFECPLQNRLALERYRRSLPHKTIEQLQEEALQLAELALIAQPAAINWMLRQLLDNEKAQVPPVEEWHLGLARELAGDQPDG